MGDRMQPQARRSGGGVGISELTDDVLAVGTGVVPATVVRLQTRPVEDAEPDPGDVLTWDGAQWTPEPSSGGGGWTLVREVNWATLPDQPLIGGGPVQAIGGVSWNVADDGNADVWEVRNGSGLFGRAKSGFTMMMWVPLATFAPGVDLALGDLMFVDELVADVPGGAGVSAAGMNIGLGLQEGTGTLPAQAIIQNIGSFTSGDAQLKSQAYGFGTDAKESSPLTLFPSVFGSMATVVSRGCESAVFYTKASLTIPAASGVQAMDWDLTFNERQAFADLPRWSPSTMQFFMRWGNTGTLINWGVAATRVYIRP